MIYGRENIVTKKFNNVSIDILPERGAIITSLNINGKEILYQGLLEETLRDTSKSIRGGIPFMFPQAGALTHNEIIQLGYTMPQHGIARNNSWTLHSESKDSISFILKASDQTTKDKIPLDFEIIATYVLERDGIRLEYEIYNKSDKTFAISPGIHPYFNIPLGEKNDIEFDKNHANKIKNEREIWQNDGTTFLDVCREVFEFYVPAVGNLQLKYDNNINNIWIWSLPSKDFVCVEPVTGNPGNIVRDPILIPAGNKYSISFGIYLTL